MSLRRMRRIVSRHPYDVFVNGTVPALPGEIAWVVAHGLRSRTPNRPNPAQSRARPLNDVPRIVPFDQSTVEACGRFSASSRRIIHTPQDEPARRVLACARRCNAAGGGRDVRNNFDAIETKLIHSGEPSPRIEGAVSMPIFQSATFAYRGESNYHDLRYIRLNNTPNHVVLHRKLAAIEGAEAALVTGSGMAAISTTLLTLLSAGDHMLAQDCLYGGTHDLLTAELPRLGIAIDFIDAADPKSWRQSPSRQHAGDTSRDHQ